LLQWLGKEYRALSRENELCADADAATQVGRDEMARALVLAEACAARLADLVYLPLEKEVIGAIRVPAPPIQRILAQVEDIRAPERLTETAVAGSSRKQDPDPTHPPFAKRLANLGFTDVPPIDQVKTSAIDQLLSGEAVRDLPARFDDQWRKKVQQLVGVGR
jgi:hypothetical protein